MKISISLPDSASTDALGAQLVAALPPCPNAWMILLQGELGAGKSTLARAMLRSMGHAGAVPSPTYTLVEPYSFTDFTAYHIDLYRISDTEELEYLGWTDLEDGFRLIEWPERVPALSALADLSILLRYVGSGRQAELVATSERGTEVIKSIGSRLVSF
jgi:tRNA threonylcarbamoyladenosine biosynthesis protein TsaE